MSARLLIFSLLAACWFDAASAFSSPPARLLHRPSRRETSRVVSRPGSSVRLAASQQSRFEDLSFDSTFASPASRSAYAAARAAPERVKTYDAFEGGELQFGGADYAVAAAVLASDTTCCF